MALTQITEKGIKDGELVNADINASAAIAGSKLAASTTSVAGSMSAADKTKLDGIEASATADQTNAEIRAAVEAASDSNVFTDADHTKLNGIAASANNYTHPNHSGDVTSSADGATTIADNAVTLAKMAGGTDGQIITYDASGDPVAVGPGTDGQVLTSTGAGSPPAFEDVPAGGAALTGSTNNTITTVTGANAIQGEANLTFDGSTLAVSSSSPATVKIEDTGGYQSYIQMRGNDMEIRGSSGQIEFYRGNADGASSSEKFRISSHGGVTFNGDTAAANCLDDYEEGTFDPQFTSGTGGGSLTAGSDYANQTGHYVKVGNMVTVQIDIKCASSGTGSISGELRISNLPFGNGGNAGAAVGFGLSQNLSNTHPNAAYMFGGGGTDLWLQERTPDNGEDPCEANQVTNNSRVICGVTYRTT